MFDSKNICLVARMSCLSNLPLSDSYLLGKKLSKEEILSPMPDPVVVWMDGVSNNGSGSSGGGGAASASGATATSTSSTTTTDTTVTHNISLTTRAWKYAAKGSRLPKKEKWTFQPIQTPMEAADFADGVIVTFHVVVYARTGEKGKDYLCIGALRSSGFIIGSTRHLRRIDGIGSGAGGGGTGGSGKGSKIKMLKKRSSGEEDVAKSGSNERGEEEEEEGASIYLRTGSSDALQPQHKIQKLDGQEDVVVL